jgi:tetratricopeptide (TPR) repeat protein
MKTFKFVAALLMAGLPAAVLAAEKAPEAASAPAAVNAPAYKNFKEAYAAGNQAAKELNWHAASAAYEAAEKLASSDKGKGQAANAEGWAFMKSKKWQEAKAAFDRATQADPDNETALKNLGVAQFRLYEYGYTDPEELKDAVKTLQAGNNEELLERAKRALAREETYAKKAKEPEPDLEGLGFKALNALGDKVQEQGRFDLAMKIFKKASAVAVSPASKGSAANRQGLALLNARQIEKSVPYFEEAAKYQPDNKVFQNNLGFGYWVLYDSGKGSKDDLKKAMDAYYKANALDASYHSENIKIALEELKEIDPEAAKTYTIKEPPEEEPAEEGQTAPEDKEAAKE